MLYLIATPLGNLKDISYRAIEALKNSDLILCEDKRRSSILLKQYAIQAPLMAFHQHNEKSQEAKIVERLESGQKISLISDAGTPLVSDPGYSIVQACIEKKLPLTSIPGPCSPIVALTLSGFEPTPFQFLGFAPKTKSDLIASLKRAFFYPGTSLFFESPQRLLKTLREICHLDNKRQVCVCREMTKVYEETVRGEASDVLSHFEKHPPKGEIVLVIGKGNFEHIDLELDELMDVLQNQHGLTKKEALKVAAKMLQKPKRYLYQTQILKS